MQLTSHCEHPLSRPSSRLRAWILAGGLRKAPEVNQCSVPFFHIPDRSPNILVTNNEAILWFVCQKGPVVLFFSRTRRKQTCGKSSIPGCLQVGWSKWVYWSPSLYRLNNRFNVNRLVHGSWLATRLLHYQELVWTCRDWKYATGGWVIGIDSSITSQSQMMQTTIRLLFSATEW